MSTQLEKDSKNPVIRYATGAWKEFRRVVWPSRQQATNHTLLVIGVSVAVAIFLGALDYLLNLGLESLL